MFKQKIIATSAPAVVILIRLVVGAVLTPPDMFSQTLLALPMYLLYEGGMIMAKIMLPEKTKP